MPSSLSHAMVAVAAGSVIAPRRLLRPFLIIGAVCAVLPDIDAIGRPSTVLLETCKHSVVTGRSPTRSHSRCCWVSAPH